MLKNSKIYVAGHTGLLGSALVGKLTERGYNQVTIKTHKELDLTDKRAVFEFFLAEKPEYVFLSAGKVGGIISNKTYPAEYLHINIAIQDNVFEAAQKFKVKHLLFYGSSCIYPKQSRQPMKEEYLLTGPLEETSKGYATAKLAGIIACKAYNQQYKTNRFIALVPNSIYGPNDNFDPENSHVLSALIQRFHKAKVDHAESVTLWGSGTPRREFVFSEDVAEASLFTMQYTDRLENSHYNVGTGVDYSIQELAASIAKTIGYGGKVLWDTNKPDGAPRKLLDSSRFLSLGWKHTVSIEEGLRKTYEWYQKKLMNRSAVSQGTLEGNYAKHL